MMESDSTSSAPASAWPIPSGMEPVHRGGGYLDLHAGRDTSQLALCILDVSQLSGSPFPQSHLLKIELP